MNPRTMTLVTALFLVGIGLATTLWELLKPAAAPDRAVDILVAAQAIEPYTIITTDMLRSGGSLPPSRARDVGAWPGQTAIGKMSTDLIKTGQVLTAVNAKPIEAVRLAADLDLEIVSFQAGVERLVGGALRPGHLINIYGYGRDDKTRRNATRIIDSRVWVVDVSAAGRRLALPTPRPDVETGAYGEEEAGGGGAAVASLITVALEPWRAARLIDALGAEGLQVWVSLAASDIARYSTATAEPAATATRPAPTPWLTPPWMPTFSISGTGFGGMAGR